MWHLRWVRLGVVMLATGLLQGVSRAAPWFPLGPFGGDVRSLAADPADPSRHLFLGTATGWVYDSHDGGMSWTRVSQIASRNDLAVDHILVDKENPKRLVVGAWVIGQPTDGGIFISEDYGKNWYSQAEMRGQSVRSLARSSSNAQELVAGTLKGVYRSLDNGVHWQRISPAGSTEIHEVESVAIDPVNPNVIYAGTWHLPWKTTDGGASWRSIKDGLIDDSDVFSIIVDPKQPNIVYASACSGIYKSSNGGETFRKVEGIPSTARRTRKLTEDAQELDTVFAGTTEGLYRTTDAGAQWERMTPANVIVNDVYIDPNDSERVLIATDRAGIYRSGDGGKTFETSNAGFSARQVTAYAQDAKDPNTLYVGLVNDKATGGVFKSSDGAVHWEQKSQGLNGADVFSLLSLEDGTLLAGTVHGIFHFVDGVWTDSSLLERIGGSPPVHAAGTVTPAVTSKSAVIRPIKAKASPVHSSRQTTSPRRSVSLRTQKPAPTQRRSSPKLVHVRKTVGRKTVSAAKSGPVQSPRPRVLVVGAGGTRRQVVRGKAPVSKAAAPMPASTARASLVRTQTTVPVRVGKEHSSPSGHISSIVYALARSHELVFAGTGDGLLQSVDGGNHWTVLKSLGFSDVHFLALLATEAAQGEETPALIFAASEAAASLSQDGGQTWQPFTLPAGLTEVGAVGVDGEKNLWIGGREGVWFSKDRGVTWNTLPNLFLTQVNSLFYDTTRHRMLVTSAISAAAFSVQGPENKVTYADTGWRLRFVRPAGDHLVAATLFDGMVVQPEMVVTPVTTAGKGPS